MLRAEPLGLASGSRPSLRRCSRDRVHPGQPCASGRTSRPPRRAGALGPAAPPAPREPAAPRAPQAPQAQRAQWAPQAPGARGDRAGRARERRRLVGHRGRVRPVRGHPGPRPRLVPCRTRPGERRGRRRRSGPHDPAPVPGRRARPGQRAGQPTAPLATGTLSAYSRSAPTCRSPRTWRSAPRPTASRRSRHASAARNSWRGPGWTGWGTGSPGSCPVACARSWA